MRPFKRPSFVLHPDGHRLEGPDEGQGYAAATPPAGSNGSRRPTLVDPSAPESDETQAKPTHPLQKPPVRTERKWMVTDEPTPAASPEPSSNRDQEIAERVVSLVHDLNQAMNEAVQNGLIVEPVLSRVKSGYGSLDDEGGYVLSLKLFRKLC